MSGGTVHVVGAGVAGLAAATGLAARGHSVVVHEAANLAGGRCRSFHDRTTGLTIDNGNHLILSGNRATIGYLEQIGSAGLLAGPEQAEFDFADAATGERWRLRPSRGRFPAWIFAKDRRVPGSRPLDYLGILRLLALPANRAIGPSISGNQLLDERLWRPVLVAALNTDPAESAAGLAARVVRETLAAGGSACRPLVAAKGLSATFIDPALRFLAERGAVIRYGDRLQAIEMDGDHARQLSFGTETIRLGPDDRVVLAVPPWIAERLLPEISTPQSFRGILNLHFAVAPPAGQPRILGIVNATAEWLFAFPDRLSVTISNADRLLTDSQEELAARIWAEIAPLTGLGPELPAWRVVKERRATFAATPLEAARRPSTRTRWRNLVLAGDWIDTGLPATIEGAIRSGNAAAAAVLTMGHAGQSIRKTPSISGGAVAEG
jgi:squalene-associated FAD-dependent desaturase